MKAPKYRWQAKIHDADQQVFFWHAGSPKVRFELYRGRFSRDFGRAVFQMNGGNDMAWAGWKLTRLDGFALSKVPQYIQFEHAGELPTILKVVGGSSIVPNALIRDIRRMTGVDEEIANVSTRRTTILIPEAAL